MLIFLIQNSLEKTSLEFLNSPPFLNRHIRGRFKQTAGRKNIFKLNWNEGKTLNYLRRGIISHFRRFKIPQVPILKESLRIANHAEKGRMAVDTRFTFKRL